MIQARGHRPFRTGRRLLASITSTPPKPFPTKSFPLTPGPGSKHSHGKREALVWWMGLGGLGRNFNLVNILWLYKYGIHLLLHLVKYCHGHSNGFQDLIFS